ncbi:hypothetical protein [Tenuifilum thalassicum]|uniref:Uncharacterized protein n=1 Tax=Tenuifilum thalassicum TaxID=2590900 RepID=A0A7D3XLL3_9BACT|nr:hypothetical protein [Tenuifilum thalassicum]QKG80475.1 hypothetical protein FHG85_09425 [Tenuifilum thalassicum]
MKIKIFTILAAVTILTSCLEGDNYIRYRDYIPMEASLLPDTMLLNETYNISIIATAPNGCWHSLDVFVNTEADTAYYFSASATFENHGEVCTQQTVTLDTIIPFTPKVNKTHLLYFYNPSDLNPIRIDTVYIKAE